MALTIYLELYHDKLPDVFAQLPGAGNYDPGSDDLYWAVALPAPPAGSPAAAFIQPVGPSGEVTATTHGSDTLPAGAQVFVPTEVAIWHPKTPPYRFTLTGPAGQVIVLDPAIGTSDDEHAWLGSTPPPGDGLGIWTVQVQQVAAADLPKSFGGRNAHLNPAMLDFTPQFFECQPLLRLTGNPDKPTEKCAELLAAAVTGGCAPGTVQFVATVENPAEAQELSWDFGDGSPSQTFGAGQIETGLAVSHGYSAADSYTAAVSLLRPSGCSPLVQVKTAAVPSCPPPGPVCPGLQPLVLLSGCAPGAVTLRASVSPLEGAEELTWDFGDGGEAIFSTAQLAQGQGLQVTHTYADPGPFTVLVTLLRRDGCTPRVLSEALEVPACRVEPRCPQLTGLSASGCMPRSGPPATVTLQAQGQDLNLAQQYIWEFGDGSTATTPGPTTSHSYNAGGPFGIQVTLVGPENCRPARQTVRLDDFTISPCPTPPDGGESCLCTLLRLLGLAALIIGAVLVFGGACSANVPLAIVGGILALIGAVILVVWGLLCGRSAGCRIFQSIIALLGVITVLLAILAVIFGILAIFEIGVPCLIGVIVDLGIIGALTVILTWIFYAIGCRWQVGASFPF